MDTLIHSPAYRIVNIPFGPAAQREILDSLLGLNHGRYAEEVTQGLPDKKERAHQATGDQGPLADESCQKAATRS